MISVNSRPACLQELVPEQLGLLHRETLPQKTKQKERKKYQNQDKDRYLGLELEFLNLSEDIQNGITKEMGAGLNLENSEQARQEDLTSDIVCFLFLW